MPTTYAHWKFGDTCIKTLPDNLQNIIKKYRNQFDYGVQGPDIFFYYKCLHKNEVNDFGYKMHDISFNEIMKPMIDNYNVSKNKEAMLAYLLGFTAHYNLDSYCHGYIERKVEMSDYSHGKIEAQFDRYLLEKDGWDPIKKKVTFALNPTKAVGQAISDTFPNISPKVGKKVAKDIKKYVDLLKDDSDFKRWILNKFFDAKNLDSYKELIMGKEGVKELTDAMLRLDKLFNKAIQHYPILAESLVAYLENGTKLDPYFKNHFGPKEDWHSIPILSLDVEKNYEVELQD